MAQSKRHDPYSARFASRQTLTSDRPWQSGRVAVSKRTREQWWMLARADRCCPLPAQLGPAIKCVTSHGGTTEPSILSDKAKLRAENDIASREETSRSALLPPEELSADREGLPRSYRMRADRHYVDQLAAPVGGQPVRMLPVDQIDSEGSFSQTELRQLIESIRAQGIVHPLLVRARGQRYVVVAGRRRLAGAQILALTSVPCLVHELDDAQAAALAAADNLATGSNSQRTEASPLPWAVRQIVAEHLA